MSEYKGALDRRKEAWHLSKEVPVALIGTMLTMIVTLSFAWSKMDSRVEAVEKTQARIEIEKAMSESKLDNKLNQIQGDITKIKDQFLLQAQNDLARERERAGRR